MQQPDTWREFMYGHLLGLLPGGIQWRWPAAPYFSGYESGALFDWDLYFESLILLYAGFPTDYVKNGVRIFLDQQQANGHIARIASSGRHDSHRTMAKPFLAQTALLAWHRESTASWLKRNAYWERLGAYLRHWFEDLDPRGEGLSVWTDAGHTGMDNHYERAGGHGYPESFCEGADLNAYLVREARAMALLAEAVGAEADARRYTEQANARAAAMQRWLWDEAQGFFFDYHAGERRPIPVKHVGAFAALWAGVATEAQAERMVREHLLNEKEFARPWPIPALAADEPGYVEGFQPGERTSCCSWRAHTWIPTNYYTFQGLRRYGYRGEAERLAERTQALFQRGRFSEYYSSESGIGTGRKPFRGWTALALFMPKELDLGIDPTGLTLHNPAVRELRRWWTENY